MESSQVDVPRQAGARLAPEDTQTAELSSDLLNGGSAALAGSAPGAATNGTTAAHFNGSSPQGSVAGAQTQAGLPNGALQSNSGGRVAGNGTAAAGGDGQGTSRDPSGTDVVHGALSTRANGNTSRALRPRFFSPARARLAASLGTFSFPGDAAAGNGSTLPRVPPGELLLGP